MAENEIEEEKTMETLEERVDLDALKERVDKLEDIVEKGIKEMEVFAQEKPMYALSVALLGGVFVGFLIGAAVSRRGS